tara:strand:+ start:2217 stop:3206 length:990 start_codon:yes stop_codon:yes gene_type:complete
MSQQKTQKAYDLLIVGSGLYGATIGHFAKKAGKKVLIIDKRPHIGGNIYTEKIKGIDVHKYGAHIFHTSNKKVWDFVNQFVTFNHFVNRPKVCFKNQLFSFPINLMTLYQLWDVKTPQEAEEKLESVRVPIEKPQNLEDWVLSEVGEGYAYDSHGNLNVSAIDSAKLLADALHEHMPIGNSIKTHFFGYEGRCATPSLFDNVYTYASGRLAASLIVDNHTGYLAAIAGFNETLSFNAVPLEVMLHQEKRQNSDVWVIKKALVELDSPAYKQFLANQESALLQEVPLKVSPRQFFGPTAMDLPLSLMLNQGYDTDKMRCIDEQYNKSNNT